MNGGGCSEQQQPVSISTEYGGGGVIRGPSASSNISTTGAEIITSLLSAEATTTITFLSNDFIKKNLPVPDAAEKDIGTCTINNKTVDVPSYLVHPPPVELIHLQPLPKHTCEICRAAFSSQFKFFEHLKAHYENVPFTGGNSLSEEHDTKKRSKKVKTSTGSDTGLDGSSSTQDNSAKGSIERVVKNKVSKEKDSVTVANNIQDVANVSRRSQMTEPIKITPAKSRPTKSSHRSEMTCPKCKKCFRKEKTFQQHISCCENFSVQHNEESHGKISKNECVENVTEESFNLNSIRHVNESIKEEIIMMEECINVPTEEIDYHTYFDAGDDLEDDDEEETELMYLQSNICPSCDEQCETKECLEKHISENHPEVFMFDLLDRGGKGVKKKKIMSTNSAASSTVKKPDVLKCQLCHRIFNHRNSLVYHMRGHSGHRPYSCEVCSKRFFATSALKVHSRLHSGVKPYTCDVCGRDFRQWGDLKYHKISIHSDVRAYQCEFCGKNFARKYSLIVHRRIHTNERNYKCEFCSKCFRAASYLQNHRRIHTGEKPHVCTICSKPFRVRSDMKRHLVSHTRDIKNITASIANALAVTTSTTTVSTFANQSDTKIIPVQLSEAVNVLDTNATLSLQQQHLPVISTASGLLSKEPTLDQNNSTEFKTEPSEQLCVTLPVVNQHTAVTANQLIRSSSEATNLNMTLSDNQVVHHSAPDILSTTMVSEAMTLYQGGGSNIEIFTTDGSRTNTMVLVPLGHTFIQEMKEMDRQNHL